MAQVRNVPEIRGLINRLADSWDRDKGRGVRMKGTYQRGVGPMVWSLTHHTVRLSRVILKLANSADLLPAVPLIRLCIENAMTASWLVVAEGAAGALVHEGLRQRKAAIDGTVKRGEEWFEAAEIQKAVEELERMSSMKLDTGKYIEKRFESLKGGGQMYGIYRIASSFSHAGLALADQYLRAVPVSESAPVGIALSPDDDLGRQEAWLGTTATMLALAMRAWDMVDAEGRHRSQVERAAKQIGTELNIALADLDARPEDVTEAQ